MLDFASSLYLGLRHPSAALGAWSELTTGKPAALEEPALAGTVAALAARLQGCEAGLVSASTLHLSLDVLGFMARRSTLLLADEMLYPIGKWGVEHAGAQGAEVRWFRHNDATSVAQLLRFGSRGRAVVLVTDAVAVDGTPVHLDRYRQLLAPLRGSLLVDNTQALGIYGRMPDRANPLGAGGGGILPYHGVRNTCDVVLMSSLAKALGAPLAILAGERNFVAAFQSASKTRVHSSPPSIAALMAARSALDANARRGDGLRRRLCAGVLRLQRGLRRLGLRTLKALFPLQKVGLLDPAVALAIHAGLWRRGIKALLLRGRNGIDPVLGFVLRADHSREDVDRLLRAIELSLYGHRTAQMPTPPLAAHAFLNA